MKVNSQLQLTDEEFLDLEMRNNRGGNDWVEALDQHGCSLLSDALIGRRLFVVAQRIIRGDYGPLACQMTGDSVKDIHAVDDWLRRAFKEALGIPLT